MKTVIRYLDNVFVVEEMTDEQMEKLKKDKPEIYAKVVKNKPEKVEEAPKAVKAKKRQAK